jgi:hypothetical protein
MMRQSAVADLLLLGTDNFTGHFEKMLGPVLRRKRPETKKRVGPLEYGVAGIPKNPEQEVPNAGDPLFVFVRSSSWRRG